MCVHMCSGIQPPPHSCQLDKAEVINEGKEHFIGLCLKNADGVLRRGMVWSVLNL